MIGTRSDSAVVSCVGVCLFVIHYVVSFVVIIIIVVVVVVAVVGTNIPSDEVFMFSKTKQQLLTKQISTRICFV
jgi:hypothetical protein